MRKHFEFSDTDKMWFSWVDASTPATMSALCAGFSLMCAVFYWIQLHGKPLVEHWFEIQLTAPSVARRELCHLARATFFTVELALSYLLMLAVMTYNAWIFICMLVCCFAAFYFFRASQLPLAYACHGCASNTCGENRDGASKCRGGCCGGSGAVKSDRLEPRPPAQRPSALRLGTQISHPCCC